MSKQKRVKRFMIKLLKKSGRQFYDDDGKKVTPEEFGEIVLKQKASELMAFKREIQLRRGMLGERNKKS